MRLILLTQVFATLFMVGLIWFVQIVHYPLYANVGREQFPEYETLHNQLTTRVVGPVMLVEMATAVVYLRYSPGGSTSLAWLGLGLGCQKPGIDKGILHSSIVPFLSLVLTQ